MTEAAAWSWRRASLAAVILGAIAVAAGAFLRHHAIPAPPYYFSEDQQVYLAVARAPFSTDPQVHHAPGCWRILPPLVARAIGEATGGGPERGFLILTFATFALLPMATFAWMKSLDTSFDAALISACLSALAPTVLGYFSWDVVRIDGFGLLLMYLGVAAAAAGRGSLAVAIVFAVVLTKETGLIAASFLVAWAAAIDRKLLSLAVVAVIGAVVLRWIVLPWVIPPSEVYPFDNLHGFRGVLEAMDLRYVARRVLLATASTWNLILIPLAIAATRRWSARDAVMAACLMVTCAQIAFASDTQRAVAAGYPFVLAWVAFELDRWSPSARRLAGVALIVGQIPWLLEYGRFTVVAGIRAVEIAIFCVSAVCFVAGAARTRREWMASRG